MINSLGLKKTPSQTRVVVAMSGGVDSSVVAAQLKKEGYEVIGITMQLYSDESPSAIPGKCCGGTDIKDAIKISRDLNFPHYVFDYQAEFKSSVIDDFAYSYSNGLTPIPCIKCNETVKFSNLLNAAKNLNADCMATGHYVRRKPGKSGVELHRALDESKDQSYFLFSTTPDQLEYLRFPLGNIKSKSETRILAKNLGLKIAEKPDSQDICFVARGKYVDFLENLQINHKGPGAIIDKNGNELGQHDGIINYTIGQRKRLGISSAEPYYVLSIDPVSNCITVGRKCDLVSKKFKIEKINWLGASRFIDSPADGWSLQVKVRSTRPSKSANIWPIDENNGEVSITEYEEAIAPGQACVFYEKDSSRVLGGGWITAN